MKRTVQLNRCSGYAPILECSTIWDAAQTIWKEKQKRTLVKSNKFGQKFIWRRKAHGWKNLRNTLLWKCTRYIVHTCIRPRSKDVCEVSGTTSGTIFIYWIKHFKTGIFWLNFSRWSQICNQIFWTRSTCWDIVMWSCQWFRCEVSRTTSGTTFSNVNFDAKIHKETDING